MVSHSLSCTLTDMQVGESGPNSLCCTQGEGQCDYDSMETVILTVSIVVCVYVCTHSQCCSVECLSR